MADYKRLQVWRKAHALALNAHRAATSIRGSQYLALRSQIIRSAMSVPANIVEGRAQRSDREFARFLRHAAASASELEYHLLAAGDVGALDQSTATQLGAQVDEVIRMLRGLIARLDGARVLAPPPSPGEARTD